jgi:hypothetical protein
MNINELLNSFLKEEAFENSLILLDIDETLLTPNNIYIYRKLPSDKKEVALTPSEYAKESVTVKTKNYYDYREFRNADSVARSIKTGVPIISNLKIMDEYIRKGWRVGILTARGMEEVIFKSIKGFLKFKNKKGELRDIGNKLIRDLVFAINDDNKKYKGITDFEKKKNVIEILAKKYNRIIFIDDDVRNVKAVKNLKIPNVMVKYATAKTEDEK